jgi:hypothetical protein
MLSVRTSARALLFALIPAAVVQLVLLALSRSAWDARTFLGLPGPDAILTLFAVQMAICAALLFGAHSALRHFHIYSRWAYALAGAGSAATAYLMEARYGILASGPTSGTWIAAAIMPMLAGALSGFLYSQLAGIERLDAPPDVATGHSEVLHGRFTGPVRVRTSLGAMSLAAVMPAVLIAILSSSIFQFGLTDAPPAVQFALPARVFMSAMFMTALPSLVMMLIVHHTARALGWTAGIHYTVLGAGYGGLFALLAAPFTAFISATFLLIPAVVIAAITAALYRRFAGLEPMPLPEAVVVADVESLVDADDPARHSHSILLNG